MMLAIDIGGSTIQFATMDQTNEIVNHWEYKTPKVTNSQEFYDFIYENSQPEHNYKGIAVSVPGVVLEDGCIASKASLSLQSIYATNIHQELKQRFNVPVVALNDGKAAALGELSIGSAKGSESSITFIIGTGIGGGITYENEVVFGKDGFAGEFSSIPVFVNGKALPLAALASASALVNQFNQNQAEKVSEAKQVFEHFHQGDDHADLVMEEWIGWIAFTLHQLTVIYNPDVICIGGGVTNDTSLVPMIIEAYKKAMEPLNELATLTTQIKRCSAPSQANLYGAIMHFHNQI